VGPVQSLAAAILDADGPALIVEEHAGGKGVQNDFQPVGMLLGHVEDAFT
jgi:hypothetical protein